MTAGFRQEHKYSVSVETAQFLKSLLPNILKRDPHSGPDHGYCIRSLYFDDPERTAYREKIAGIQERSKYRLRFYNFDPSYIVFEKKERFGDACRKSSARVSREIAEQLVRGECVFHDSPLLEEYEKLWHSGLRPAVIVDYYRYAFLWPYSDVRVTLDCNLTTPVWSCDFFNPDLPCYPVYEDGEALLELKYNDAAPEFLENLLASIPKVKVANSKYTRCLALLDE